MVFSIAFNHSLMTTTTLNKAVTQYPYQYTKSEMGMQT